MSIYIPVIGADGIARSRILVFWAPPADGYVTTVEVQYQKEGDGDKWIGLTSVDVKAGQVAIDGVTDGITYNVRLRSRNVAGVPSDWTLTEPVTVSGVPSEIGPSSLTGVLLQANNLSDLLDVPAARTNLGLLSAATHAATDFDVSGAAAAAVAAIPNASATETGLLTAADWNAFAGATGTMTHTEILVDSHGPITESTADFIYVLGVPN